jgi:hypothetical protein
MKDLNDEHPLYTPPLETLVDYINFLISMDIFGLIIIGAIIIGCIWIVNKPIHK